MTAVLGTLLMLGLGKMNDYMEGSLLFSQLRMLLVVPYIIILILYFMAAYEPETKTPALHFKTAGIFLIVFLCLTVCKVATFEMQVRNQESVLYTDAFPVSKVTDVLQQGETVISTAREQKADVIVVNTGREIFGYALAAEYYGEFTFYNTSYDRRTWVYHKLLKPDDYNVLFVDFFGNSLDTESVQITDMSVPDYIAKRFGVYRNPYTQK